MAGSTRKYKRTGFGKFLAHLRVDHDESTEDMAKRIDVSRATLRKYETTNIGISNERIALIEREYGVTGVAEIVKESELSVMGLDVEALSAGELEEVRSFVEQIRQSRGESPARPGLKAPERKPPEPEPKPDSPGWSRKPPADDVDDITFIEENDLDAVLEDPDDTGGVMMF